MNGIQSMLLTMLGGPEGVERLLKNLFQGVDPIKVALDIKESYDELSRRIGVLEQRQIALEVYLRAKLGHYQSGAVAVTKRGNGADPDPPARAR